MKAFTTIEQVTSDEPYQVTQARGFEPFRVDVDYVQEVTTAPIVPRLEKLELTKGRTLSNHNAAIRYEYNSVRSPQSLPKYGLDRDRQV